MVRIKAVLGLAAVAGGLFLSAPAQADDCHYVPQLDTTNCTYVDGTCVYGGGRIGDRSRYMYNTCGW